MFYVLNEKYEFCSYKLLPYVLKIKDLGTFPIDSETYKVLSMCDGKIDFDIPLITDNERNIVAQLKQKKIIRERKDENDIRNIKTTYYDNRYIQDAHFLLTGKCNFKCKHCYMSATNKDAVELPFDKICYIINELKNNGIFTVDLSGGECLIRNDFMDIVDKLIEAGIYIRKIYSNGWLINEKLLDEFEKRNIKPGFSISFDGLGWHDYIRGVKGAERRINEVFDLCKKSGYYVDVEYCLFQKNKDVLIDSLKYLQDKGVTGVKINPVARIGNWKGEDKSDDISISELFDIAFDFLKKYFENNLHISIHLYFFRYDGVSKKYNLCMGQEDEDLDNTYVCGHARTHSFITEKGDVIPCSIIGTHSKLFNFPSIFDKGLKECLNNSYYMEFITTPASKVINHNEKCKECKYKKLCKGGCRASGCFCTNDLLGIDESYCRFYTGGYYEKFKDFMHKIKPELECTT